MCHCVIQSKFYSQCLHNFFIWKTGRTSYMMLCTLLVLSFFFVILKSFRWMYNIYVLICGLFSKSIHQSLYEDESLVCIMFFVVSVTFPHKCAWKCEKYLNQCFMVENTVNFQLMLLSCYYIVTYMKCR